MRLIQGFELPAGIVSRGRENEQRNDSVNHLRNSAGLAALQLIAMLQSNSFQRGGIILSARFLTIGGGLASLSSSE